MTDDRVRAKPSTVGDWSTGVVESVEEKEYGYDIVVEDGTRLSVTKAVYDLFSGRVDSDTPVGEKIWYKKKN